LVTATRTVRNSDGNKGNTAAHSHELVNAGRLRDSTVWRNPTAHSSCNVGRYELTEQ
jgi:hypothetical protein